MPLKNIRVKEAAAYVGLSKSSLDKLRCFGGGPRFYKLGRSVVYNTADLDAWVVERARTSTWCANDNRVTRATAA
ncbi:helix-turn-helix transcriptional regulator [Sinorhizobium meliloti]|uniref:helix-turn-helix transcriptional regulator n=1 Tax=Rhizobium meliloti TaxID=382 RepID=UPI001F315F5B|nr:helix-turn-helix domain-containing protein [Sinorhizobium meliloti]MDW9899101.1 helix-turn-helix domain-containing protein [Sinorhizobium meliloti]